MTNLEKLTKIIDFQLKEWNDKHGHTVHVSIRPYLFKIAYQFIKEKKNYEPELNWFEKIPKELKYLACFVFGMMLGC